MTVIEDLDAFGRLVEVEQLGEAGEDRGLRGRFGETPRQRLARIDQGMLDQLALLAAHRRAHVDPVPGLQRQSFGEKTAAFDGVREKHELGRRLVVVELGDERFQHLLDGKAFVGAREIGAVAPIVPGAEEKHLDAGLACLQMRGEHIGFLHTLRVDALARLDVAERG